MAEDTGLTTQAPAGPAGPSTPAAEPTLRDTITSAVAEVTKPDDAAKPSGAPTAPDAAAKPAEGASGDTGTRQRNADGTFAPGSAKPAAPAAAPTPEPAAAAIPMPSSLKPEAREHWDKTPEFIRQEIARREADYARGVSVYKAEFDRLRPLDQVVAPYRDVMKQHNVSEAQIINNLLQAHHGLAFGSQQDRVSIVQKVLSDYKMPVRLATQGQDGQWSLLDISQIPQPQPAQPQARPQAPQENLDELLEKKLTEREVRQTLNSFIEAKDTAGNPQYPHYEKVKDVMASLLELGKAPDLPSAYQMAVRVDDQLWQEAQTAKAAADAKTKADVAARARAKVVSVPSANPTGAEAAGGDKSLRDQLRENVAAAVGGRI